MSKSRSYLKREWVDLLPQKNQDPSFENDWVLNLKKNTFEDEVKRETEQFLF